MENTNRSLSGFMKINRNFIKNKILEINNANAPATVITYKMSDFGENAINNHGLLVDWHSERAQYIFNYVTSGFRDRCTSFESYKTPSLGNNIVSDILKACSIVDADIVYTPYIDAARNTNTVNDNMVITVGSHYDNDGQWDNRIGSDNNRHDITKNSTTFLSNSIAVSARRDTPELFKNSTSEGYGMEFFEDLSPEGLDQQYPEKNILASFAELLTDDGYMLYSNVHTNFSNNLSVGDHIIIKIGSDESTWESTYVSEIISPNQIKVSNQIPVISTSGIYGWKFVTLGGYMWGQAESWAVPLVAGKLKVIKMTTNSDWNTVRMAARATAKRNPTGIPEIDNSNWDMWRGFGQIQVQEAIDFINLYN